MTRAYLSRHIFSDRPLSLYPHLTTLSIDPHLHTSALYPFEPILRGLHCDKHHGTGDLFRIVPNSHALLFQSLVFYSHHFPGSVFKTPHSFSMDLYFLLSSFSMELYFLLSSFFMDLYLKRSVQKRRLTHFQGRHKPCAANTQYYSTSWVSAQQRHTTLHGAFPRN